MLEKRKKKIVMMMMTNNIKIFKKLKARSKRLKAQGTARDR